MQPDEVVSQRGSREEHRFSVHLKAEGHRFAAPPDRTLLQSAEAAGVTMLSSCRAGTCRTCMRRMVSGAVAYRIEWPGLLREEKDEGWVLPCVAYPLADVDLE
jgi:ferredoxin